MAGAAPGRSNNDDSGDYDVRRHGTPPRRPQAEGEGDVEQPAAQAGLPGQPAGSGGAISINLIHEVAQTLRTEMHAVRADLESKFNTMNRDFEIKMSGRKGTGHYEAGAIETLLEKVKTIEKDIKEIAIGNTEETVENIIGEKI